MKHEAKARACRLDLSVAELETLLQLAQLGQASLEASRGYCPHQALVAPTIAGLQQALSAQSAKRDDQRRAAADRRARAAGPDPRRERHMVVDGHPVRAEFGDYVDVGTAEFSAWKGLRFLEIMKQVPPQAEIRRGVWLVHVMTRLEDRADDDRLIVGSETTPDAGAIEGVARQVLAARGTTSALAPVSHSSMTAECEI